MALSTAMLRRARGEVPQGPQKGAPKEGDIKLPAGGTMPMRTLGRTGVKVSLLGLGGYHLGIPRADKEAVRIIHAAMDHGVTFLDNCWDYNGGKSEERMGIALAEPSRRQKAFLMTKLDGRTKDSAAQQLEQSLKRLRTDQIDLVQVHEVIRMEDPDRVFGPGGAIEALVAAKKAGKLRFIGFTGHKDPAIHLHMLETAAKHGFVFDSVQMPVNVMDAHYKSFAKKVIPRARETETGVLGMKALGSGIILQSGVVEAPECLRYSMSQPVSVQITGCDTMGVLEQALAVALGFTPMPATDQEKLLARTAQQASEGRFERFKTSGMFDGTAQHPKWLETASI
ncbi:MAG: Nucleoside-diphosphate-sugar epimerase [bacterium]|nr:Nucleoside-diphosphate-sugar epimerase [bacterium]